MNSHSSKDGSPTGATLGADFTNNVVAAMGPNTSPRLREVMTALIRHVHDFVREVQLTTDEWMAGVQWINWTGQMSTDERNEGQLLCDLIGLDSLVDDITLGAASKHTNKPTASAILSPFWRSDALTRENGSSLSLDTSGDGQIVYMYGIVMDAASGHALPGATVDVWQALTNGLYEQQDAKQQEHNLRGIFRMNAQGQYCFYCLRPTPYPILKDGPAGKLLDLMDRNVFRPAHIHLMVRASGHKTLFTQIFDQDCRYLSSDSVFAVKDELKVRFEPRQGDVKTKLELECNISLPRTV